MKKGKTIIALEKEQQMRMSFFFLPAPSIREIQREGFCIKKKSLNLPPPVSLRGQEEEINDELLFCLLEEEEREKRRIEEERAFEEEERRRIEEEIEMEDWLLILGGCGEEGAIY